ncbi:hypothetical protein Cgig2_029810 [Carnegiea gigantea]|uniref:Uncharacterized protein n=1 Tax=Carnegiea gigantea TaxID=171969 RepID=A0A9Q1KL89_9CARY|nr:hypothetical protein Cgig2_029810 [Carnegiea gigantea]
MDGALGNERAPLENGRECGYRPYCRCSSSLRSLNAIPSSTFTSILVRKVRVKQGTLCYRRNDENKCIDVSKDYENYFNVTVLEKVNIERRGPEIYPTEGEFCPALHRLLTTRRNWGPTFQFRGRSTFMLVVMEWTKRFLNHFDANLWWILGSTNQYSSPWCGRSHNKYPAAVAELLRIHTELCEFHKAKHIYHDLWLDHFCCMAIYFDEIQNGQRLEIGQKLSTYTSINVPTLVARSYRH